MENIFMSGMGILLVLVGIFIAVFAGEPIRGSLLIGIGVVAFLVGITIGRKPKWTNHHNAS